MKRRAQPTGPPVPPGPASRLAATRPCQPRISVAANYCVGNGTNDSYCASTEVLVLAPAANGSSTGHGTGIEPMPIYEYLCRDCREKFEKLILRSSQAANVPCPRCGRTSTEQLFSTFAMASTSGDAATSPACGPCSGCFT